MAGAVLAAALLSSGLVGAQPAATPAGEGRDAEPASGDRDRTRALANDGLRAFRRGDYVTALSKFEQAEAIVPAPTIALHRARSLEKLGRLAEALERYAAIASAAVPAEAPYVHHRAQQDAQVEMLALEPRVPTVTVVVDGVPGAGAELVVDGRATPWSSDADRMIRRLDPGQHRFELRRRDGTRAAAGVQVTERQKTDVRLTLPPPRPGGAPGSDGEGGASEGSEGGGWEHQRTAGWIAVSAGGVGLGLALITGAAAIVIGGDLSDRCPDGACPPEAWDDVDTHDSFRAASTIGFVFAGVFGAGGAVLLLTAPDEPDGSPPSTSARATVEPRGVSLRVDY